VSIASILLDDLQRSLGKEIVGTVKTALLEAVAGAVGNVVAKLPTDEELAARIRGNPRFKAWLSKQTAEDQAAVKRALELGAHEILASCSLETVVKVLTKR